MINNTKFLIITGILIVITLIVVAILAYFDIKFSWEIRKEFKKRRKK